MTLFDRKAIPPLGVASLSLQDHGQVHVVGLVCGFFLEDSVLRMLHVGRRARWEGYHCVV